MGRSPFMEGKVMEYAPTMEERARKHLILNYQTYLLAMSQAHCYAILLQMQDGQPATENRLANLRRKRNDYMDTALVCRQFARDLTEILTGHDYWLAAVAAPVPEG